MTNPEEKHPAIPSETEPSLSATLNAWFARLRENPQWAFYALAAVLSYITAGWVMRRFPHSGDEYSYIYQANTWLAGRLVNPVSPFPPAYTPIHCISAAWGVFSKYPPGWPLLLAFGEALSLGYLVAPVIGVVTLVRGYALAERLAGRASALAMTAMLATSSYFLFNSSSFYPHAAVLLALVLIFDYLDRYRDEPTTRNALIPALCLGFIVLARPFDAVVILGLLLPVLGTYFFRHFGKQLARHTAMAVGVQILAVGIYLLYNKGTTHQFLLFGHYLSDVADHPELDPVNMHRPLAFRAKRFLEAFSPILLVPLAFLPRRADVTLPRRLALGLLAFAGLFWICYAAYLVPDLPPRYGPRYLYPSLFPIALLAAVGLMQVFSGGVRWIAVALVCAAQLVQTYNASAGLQLAVDAGTGIYQASTQLGAMLAPQQLLVGVNGLSGSIPTQDLIRNDLDYEQKVLFVKAPLGIRPPVPAMQDRLRYTWDGIGGAPTLWTDDPKARIPMLVLGSEGPVLVPREQRTGWVVVSGSNRCYGEYPVYPGLRDDIWARLGPCPGNSSVSWSPVAAFEPEEVMRQGVERFYTHFRTFVTIEKEGIYHFTLETEGGGALIRVGNMIVLDKDPLTTGGQGSGTAMLKPGTFPMSVSAYHLQGLPRLKIGMLGPDGNPMPAESFHTLPPGPISFYGNAPDWTTKKAPPVPF